MHLAEKAVTASGGASVSSAPAKLPVAPARLNSAAERIMNVVEKERPVDRPTLRGLVDDRVMKRTAELERQVQSLKAKLETSPRQKAEAATGRTATAASPVQEQPPQPQEEESSVQPEEAGASKAVASPRPAALLLPPGSPADPKGADEAKEEPPTPPPTDPPVDAASPG